MDLSLTLHPTLVSSICSTREALEYLDSYDVDLFSEALNIKSSMAYTTIEPSQFAAFASSSSNPSPNTSPLSSADFVSLSRPPEYTNDSVSRRFRKYKQKTSHSGSDSTIPNHSHVQPDPAPRVKRHQTKLACSWCRKLGKKCDAQRPCGRCVRFDRFSECFDAPPRKARAKCGERGAYKKTRDLAAVDYQGAVQKRQAYVTKQERLGRTVKLGLSPDEILEKAREENEKMIKKAELLWLTSFIDEDSGLSPVTGSSEETVEESESRENADLDLSLPSSAEGSVFDTSTTNGTSVTELDDPLHINGWKYHSLDLFPNIMGLIAAARALESAPHTSDSNILQPRSDTALTS